MKKSDQTQPVDADKPGLGQFYCVSCAKYFVGAEILAKHVQTRPHKRRLKLALEEQYSQREAEAAAGMGAPEKGVLSRPGRKPRPAAKPIVPPTLRPASAGGPPAPGTPAPGTISAASAAAATAPVPMQMTGSTTSAAAARAIGSGQLTTSVGGGSAPNKAAAGKKTRAKSPAAKGKQSKAKVSADGDVDM